MASLRTLVISLIIHVRLNNVYLLLLNADICHQLKAIHNTTKYAPYLRWSHEEKSNYLVQMNICALRLIIAERDLYGSANDPRTANDPGPQMIPKLNRK